MTWPKNFFNFQEVGYKFLINPVKEKPVNLNGAEPPKKEPVAYTNPALVMDIVLITILIGNDDFPFINSSRVFSLDILL